MGERIDAILMPVISRLYEISFIDPMLEKERIRLWNSEEKI